MNPSPAGAGSPYSSRSGTVSRRIRPIIGFINDSGIRRSATPITWLGTPSTSRRTMFGGAGRIATYPGDFDAELGRDVETRRIVIEVRDQIVPADPQSIASRKRHSGQRREPAGGVQMQTVIAAAPGRSDRLCAFEKRVRGTPLAEHRGNREAAGAGAHDDRLVSYVGTLRRGWRRVAPPAAMVFIHASLARHGSAVVRVAHTDAVQTREHIESPPVGREMTDNECRCRIREASSARLRVLGDGAPTDVDVTYSVDGNTVVLRPSDDSRSDVLHSRRSALLEIDQGSVGTRTRWRVVVTGLCGPITTEPDQPPDGIELRIEFLEGRHVAPDALPPGSMVPQPRRAAS